ncbi:MAG: MATE family efflux transporter [Anaerovoracaceae bacterium]|nr:MATE family efflux transporter [Anaerovoracaceae bacterium]
MTRGPVGKELLLFCIPVALTSMLQLLFNAADIIVVGQFVGAEAVAAIGATTFLINLLVTFFIGMSIGVTVVISTDLGAGRLEDVKTEAHTAVAVSVLFGIAIACFGAVFCRTFLTWMATPADIIDMSASYLRIYFIGVLGLVIYSFGRAVLITTGDTKRPMYYLIASGCINVALNLVLVIRFDMGVTGVGIATAVSQFVSAYLVINRLRHIKGPCGISIRNLHINKGKLRKIIRLGLPTGLQGMVFSISNVMIQSSVNSLGTLYVAGNAAASNLEGFVFMTMDAFNQGVTTFMGQNYGAGRDDRFVKIWKTGTLQVACAGLGFGLILLAAGRFLLGIYLPTSATAVSYGYVRMKIFMTTYFICGMMNVATGCIRGLNRPLVPMIATTIGVCLVRIVYIIFGFGPVKAAYGPMAAYISLVASYPVTWVLTGLFLVWYFFRLKNRISERFAANRSAEAAAVSEE